MYLAPAEIRLGAAGGRWGSRKGLLKASENPAPPQASEIAARILFLPRVFQARQWSLEKQVFGFLLKKEKEISQAVEFSSPC